MVKADVPSQVAHVSAACQRFVRARPQVGKTYEKTALLIYSHKQKAAPRDHNGIPHRFVERPQKCRDHNGSRPDVQAEDARERKLREWRPAEMNPGDFHTFDVSAS